MQSKTLFSLVEKIRVQRIRLNNHAHPSAYTGPWTPEDELKFIEVDISLTSWLNSTGQTSQL